MIKRRVVKHNHSGKEIIIVVRARVTRSMLTGGGGVGQPRPQNQQQQRQKKRGKLRQRTQILQQSSTPPLVARHISDHPPREEWVGGTKHQGEVCEPRLLMIRKRNMSLVVACQY
jgi:hypothetical protein